MCCLLPNNRSERVRLQYILLGRWYLLPCKPQQNRHIKYKCSCWSPWDLCHSRYTTINVQGSAKICPQNLGCIIFWSPVLSLLHDSYCTFFHAEFIPPEIPPFLIVENVTSKHFSRYGATDDHSWNRSNILGPHTSCYFRFFIASYAATGTASLESCVKDYFFSAVDSTILYADTTTNMCYFGDADTSTGAIITPSDSSWPAYIKTCKCFGDTTFGVTKFNKCIYFISICGNNQWGLYFGGNPKQWPRPQQLEQVCVQSLQWFKCGSG